MAICFFMPLFVSELLGICAGLGPRARLCAGAFFGTALFVGLEVVAPLTRFAIRVLEALGPRVGILGPFRMTSDWTDLLCLLVVPAAVA